MQPRLIAGIDDVKLIELDNSDLYNPGLGSVLCAVDYDCDEDAVVYIESPVWDAEMRKALDELYTHAFVDQGGVFKNCKYCGRLFPLFPFGIERKGCGVGECSSREETEDFGEFQEILKETKEAEKHFLLDQGRRNSHEYKIPTQERTDERRQKHDDEKRRQKEARRQAEEARKQSLCQDDRPGFVYLMWSETGLWKIGRAKSVEARLGGLNREIPIEIKVEHHFASRDYIKAEKVLHERYSNERVKYEWFRLSPEQVENIKSIQDHGLDDLI